MLLTDGETDRQTNSDENIAFTFGAGNKLVQTTDAGVHGQQTD